MTTSKGCVWIFISLLIFSLVIIVIGFFQLITEEYNNVNLGTKYYACPGDGTRKFIHSNYGLYLRNEIQPYVSDYVYDSNFVLVEQIPNKDDYSLFLKSQMESNFQHYDSLTLQQKMKVYWDNYSDSINYLLLNEIRKKIDYFEKNPIKKDTLTKAQIDSGIATIVLESDYRGDFDYYLKKIVDSLVNNNPFHKRVWASEMNYWILSLKNDSLYGPYQRMEFLNSKLTLGVSQKLKLNFE